MHKLYQQQLEQALEQLEFPSSSCNPSLLHPNSHHSLHQPSTTSSSYHHATNSARKQFSLSPSSSSSDYYPRKRSQSVVDSSENQIDVASSLTALDALHEKLKMLSQENKQMKMQLEGSTCRDNMKKKGFGGSFEGASYQELDYENFILKKEKEELVARVDELERRMREMESRRRDWKNKEVIIEENEEEDSNNFDRLIEESNEQEIVEDLSILLENEEIVNERKSMEMRTTATLDISIQCESIEKDDKETNTNETEPMTVDNEIKNNIQLEIGQNNLVLPSLEDEKIANVKLEEIEMISEEIQTIEDYPSPVVDNSKIMQLAEQIENLKAELQLKTDLISTLQKEKEQHEKNEQEHQKVMNQLTSHVKELVKESALLRREYNESIRKLKEELIACNDDNKQ